MERRKFLAISGLSVFAFSVSDAQLVDSEGSYTGCDPTTMDMLGPFFKRGVPIQTDLTYPDCKNEVKINIMGKVFGSDCTSPLEGVLINIWHCDDRKNYDMEGNKCRGKVQTAADGSYSFNTFIPPPYAGRPKHVHYLVEVEGYEDLITQLYFKGDRKIKKNNWNKFPWDEKRILEPYKNDQDELEVVFDLYLKKAE